MQQAIDLFATFPQSMKKSSSYLHKKEAVDVLTQVLALAPQYLSAKLLLDEAGNKTAHTLSVSASQYYTFLASRKMIDALTDRNFDENKQVPSGVVRTGMVDLNKLRPMVDPKIRPLLEAWARYIASLNSLQQGSTTKKEVEVQRQSLLAEMAKEQSDQKLMRKMLKDGM